MLSTCLSLYFGQASYNPGKVGWFGNVGKGQSSYNPGKVESSDNPGKVGWFGNLGNGQSSDNPGKVGGFTHAKGIVG